MFNFSKKTFEVITIGSATRDVFLGEFGGKKIKSSDFETGEALELGLGSKFEVKKFVSTTGGGGTNAAMTFARQGFETACIAAIAHDINGQEIIAQLSAEKIDTSSFQIHNDDMTAYSVILVDESGERTILSYKGEGQHFNAIDLKLEGLKTNWVFVSSLGGHLDMLEKITAWAVANNVKLAINPGTKDLALGLDALLPHLKNFSIVSMNQEEAAELLGLAITDEEAIFKKMDELIGGVFVMTNGHAGVKVSDGTHVYSAGVPDSPVIERTGAGDAFAAGFTAEYIRSGDITKAIQLGTANASSVVTQYGGKAGILKAGEMGPWSLVEVSQK